MSAPPAGGFPRPIDLAEKLALFEERWSPKIVAQVNACDVKLAKLEGEFVWHAHADEDELFLVLEGQLELRFRSAEDAPEHSVQLGPGQMIVVPRGLEHLPSTPPGGASVLLFEPRSTVNTGAAGGQRTVTDLERL